MYTFLHKTDTARLEQQFNFFFAVDAARFFTVFFSPRKDSFRVHRVLPKATSKSSLLSGDSYLVSRGDFLSSCFAAGVFRVIFFAFLVRVSSNARAISLAAVVLDPTGRGGRWKLAHHRVPGCEFQEKKKKKQKEQTYEWRVLISRDQSLFPELCGI